MERNICNNNLLRFDPSKATTDQIRQWLFSIIDAEIDKDESEIDYDLIEQCTICEASLAGDPMALTDEEYQRDLARILKKRSVSNKKFISEKAEQKAKLSVSLRIIAIAAALAIAAFSALTVFAKIKGYKNAWDLVYQNFAAISAMEFGDKVEENKITVVKNSGAIYYSSLEEFRDNENLDILIPTHIPESIELKRILLYEEDNNKYTWNFQFSNANLEITLRNYYISNVFEDSFIYKTDLVDFYISNSSGEKYQAVGQLNGYEYTIRYTDYNELLKILDNMKGK